MLSSSKNNFLPSNFCLGVLLSRNPSPDPRVQHLHGKRAAIQNFIAKRADIVMAAQFGLNPAT